uniref:Uncharacterized protein n=1 Tax=Romanomermis culicivorax TaxID=13658 RepID=A0A915KYK5_ROMCU
MRNFVNIVVNFTFQRFLIEKFFRFTTPMFDQRFRTNDQRRKTDFAMVKISSKTPMKTFDSEDFS